MARILWKTVDGEVKSYKITGRETVIGRDPGCQIVIDDERVSRRHCSILKVEKSFILQDLGSRNGTRVDHEMVSRSVLHDEAKITVGKTTLEFQLADENEEVSHVLRTRWLLPEDWSSVEQVVEASFNPHETTIFREKQKHATMEDLHRAHERLDAFYRISTSLGSLRTEKELLDKLLEDLFKVFPAEQGFVLLLDRRMGAMKPVTARRVSKKAPKSITGSEKSRRIAVSHTILEQLIHDKTAVLTHDATLDERFTSSDSIIREQMHSAMCAPLLQQNQVIGVIQIASFSKKHAFHEDDLRLFSIIANQTAVWLENIRLYDESKQKVNELNSLFKIGKAISSNLALDNLLDMIMLKALELIHAESGSIMLVDEATRRLTITASVGLKKEIVQSVSKKIGEGISGWVAEHGQALLLKDNIVDTRFVGIKRDEKVKDALCVPLIIGGSLNGKSTGEQEEIEPPEKTGKSGKVIGVLSVNNKMGELTFDAADLDLLSNFATQAAIAIENARLYSSLRNVYLDTVKAFANAIEARDPYTRGHCDRLSAYAYALGRELGMTAEELESLQGAGLLHDIGKIGIREDILQKPKALTDQEYESIKQHPALGARILESIPAMKDLLPVIHHHQEKFDGTGYPDGLKGNKIPLGARIIAVIDAFDAMTSDRPYRKKLSLNNAIAELKKHAGTQFDPEIVTLFITLIEREGWSETVP